MKRCKHGTFPDDRLRLFCKTAKPTAVGDSLKSPALRGFVGGLRALATAALYLVLKSNGPHHSKNLPVKFGFLLKTVPANIAKKLPL